MFQRIVIGFDDSASAHDAVALALTLADADARFVVVCAYPTGGLTARVVPTEHGALGADDAATRLDAARALLDDRTGVEYVAEGASSAAAALHGVATANDADLIVVGSSHRGPVGRIVPGTTAAQVLHAAPCAVAIAPAGLRNAAAVRMRAIGVGFDGEPESRRALASAAQIAGERHGRLHVIAVMEPVTQTFGWAGAWMYPEFRDDAIADTRREIAAALEALEDAPDAVEQIVDGMPATELLRASERLDLLVLGSRGFGPVGRLLVGSVAARVAGSCGCSLLVFSRCRRDPPAYGRSS
jgi:nucleotide-binding universal stress UspA family protein